MAKYTWNNDLITGYMLDPTIGPEFDSAFSFLEGNKNSDEEKSSPLRVISRDFNFFASNPFVYRDFSSIITPSTTYFTYRTKGRRYSINEALFLTNAFYSQTDAEITSAFNINYDKRFSHLMAIPTSRKRYSNYSGHCYFSETAKDCLISFNATMDFEMACVLIHEYAHATAFVLRDYKLQDLDNEVFSEIESIFMELIAYEWLKNNTTLEKEAILEMKKIYNEILDCARFYLETSEVCDMVSDMNKRHEKINMRNIIAQARAEFNCMPASYLKKLLDSSVEFDAPYGYSGLIAIELYQRFLQDPASTLELYKRILNLQRKTASETEYALTQMGIHAGEHFDDFAKSLKR